MSKVVRVSDDTYDRLHELKKKKGISIQFFADRAIRERFRRLGLGR